MAIAEPVHVLTEEDLTTIEVSASRLVGNFGFAFQDREDIQQDLALDLLEHLPRFDPARAKRSTFVKRCVENRISKMIRDCRRQCRDHRRLSSIDADPAGEERLADGAFHGTAPSSSQGMVDLRLDVAAIVTSLPEDQQEICELLPDHSPRSIARVFGRSKRKVYEQVEAIRDAFQRAGLAPADA